MKNALIYIGILFSAVSCSPNGFRPATGDLLFQVNESSAMTDAITSSTGKNSPLNFSHVAIAMQCGGADSVIEASAEAGVRRISLADFLASSAQTAERPAVVVMRMRDTTGVAASVRRTQKFLGQPYDYSYLPRNGKMYCSELVYESFLKQDGTHRFTARPMNFRNAAGELPAFWSELFATLGEPVPEGVEGTNPNDLSHEAELEEVYRYF